MEKLRKCRINPEPWFVHFPFALITSNLPACWFSRMVSCFTSAVRGAVYRRVQTGNTVRVLLGRIPLTASALSPAGTPRTDFSASSLLPSIALSTLLIPAIASAELSYNHVQLNHERISKNGIRDLSMSHFNTSKEIASHIYLDGKYGTGTQNTGSASGDASAKEWVIGAGYHTPIQTYADLVITAHFRQITTSASGASSIGKGRVLGIGARIAISPQFEGLISTTHTSSTAASVTNNAYRANAELGFRVTPQFQLIFGFATNAFRWESPVRAVDVGMRYFY